MDPIRLARPRSRRTLGAPGPPTPAAAHRCYPKPLLYPLSDRGTKWLGQGKAFDYAQQNVNPDRVSRPPQALGQRARLAILARLQSVCAGPTGKTRPFHIF